MAKVSKKAIIEMFDKKGGNISATCRALNVSRQTFYRYLKNEKFKQEIDDIQESIIDFTESQLILKIQEGCTSSIQFLLKTKGKKRGYTEKMEIANPEGEIFKTEVSQKELDELQAQIKELQEVDTDAKKPISKNVGRLDAGKEKKI